MNKKTILIIIIIIFLGFVASMALLDNLLSAKYYKIENNIKIKISEKDVPNCGENYNLNFDLSLKNKDITFCWNNKYSPNTVIFDNGIITENVCRNSKNDIVFINDETCVKTFSIYNNQPQLCTLFGNDILLYEAMSMSDKNIANEYLKGQELKHLDGFAINCIFNFVNIKNNFEGCHYLNKQIDYYGNVSGEDLGYSDEELCIQKFYTDNAGGDMIFGCDKYDFKSPSIKRDCNHQ